MKQEWKDKWVAALRSGEYKQGIGHLQTKDGGFCCLGVLCDVVHKELGIGEWEDQSDRNTFSDQPRAIFVVDSERTSGQIPEKIREIVSMHSNNGLYELDETYEKRTLWRDNDRNGKTFNEIADIIEKHWEEL